MVNRKLHSYSSAGSSMPRPYIAKSSALKTSLWLCAIAQIFGLWYFLGTSEAKHENNEAILSKPIVEGFFATLKASVHDQFPGLNAKEVAYFKMHSLTPNLSGWELYGCALAALVIPLIGYALWKDHQGEDEWLAKVDEDRSAIYRQHPGAMRLAGASSYMSESFESLRKIDPFYDVQPRKKIRKHRSTFWFLTLQLAFSGLATCGALLIGNEIVKAERIPEFFEQWGGWMAIGCLGLGIPLAIYTLITESRERPLERKVQTNSIILAHFRKTGSDLYHDRVLKELGFEKLGTYLYRKHSSRLIYLSQAGNLLIELVKDGFPGNLFFVLSTVTNDGKFLETSSMVTPKHEKRDVNIRFQGRSASHGDIVRALAEHDQLVEEFTYGGSVQEAQFTEENYERFLRWGGEKNAV